MLKLFDHKLRGATMVVKMPDVFGIPIEIGHDRLIVPAKVGEKGRLRFVDEARANQHDASFWAGGGGIDVVLGANWYMPTSVAGSIYATPWAIWATSPEGDGAMEPPAEVQRQIELFNELLDDLTFLEFKLQSFQDLL